MSTHSKWRTRKARAVAVVVATLTIIGVTAMPATANSYYGHKTFSKAVTSTGAIYLTAEKACLRYSVQGTLKYTTNRGGIGLVDVSVVDVSLASPRINVSITKDCSTWTYVSASAMTTKTSVYSTGCLPSLSAGLSVPWGFTLGVSGTCSSKKTATVSATDRVKRSQYSFTNQGRVVKLASAYVGTIGTKNLTYCSRAAVKIQTTLPAGTASPATKDLSLCMTVANPYYGGV